MNSSIAKRKGQNTRRLINTSSLNMGVYFGEPYTIYYPYLQHSTLSSNLIWKFSKSNSLIFVKKYHICSVWVIDTSTLRYLNVLISGVSRWLVWWFGFSKRKKTSGCWYQVTWLIDQIDIRLFFCLRKMKFIAKDSVTNISILYSCFHGKCTFLDGYIYSHYFEIKVRLCSSWSYSIIKFWFIYTLYQNFLIYCN